MLRFRGVDQVMRPRATSLEVGSRQVPPVTRGREVGPGLSQAGRLPFLWRPTEPCAE